MKTRKMARIVALILAFIMLFSVLFSVISSLTANALVTQAQIDKLKEEKKEYEKKKQEIQSRINTIEYERMTEVAKKTVLDDRIALTGHEIDNIGETIEYYDLLIVEKEKEFKAAERYEENQLDLYKERVRSMEENGVISYLGIVFDSNSFSDLLARLDFVTDMMNADERRYFELTKAREDTKLAKEALELTKVEMEAERVVLNLKYEELGEQLTEASALIIKIEGARDSERVLYEEMSAEADKVQSEINSKVEELRKQEAAAAAAAAAAARPRGSGDLLNPVPSGGIISSSFGVRRHPVYGVFRQHWGVDLTASYNANIVAAASGTVITSAYSTSYGNYIVISHGNGWTTLYAHLNSRKVSVGDTVARGQLIGLAGSTGVSTGAHLHFEVSINGQRDDPAKYL